MDKVEIQKRPLVSTCCMLNSAWWGHGSTCYHRGRRPLDRWSPGFQSPDPNRALVPRDPGAGLEGCLPAFSEFMALKMMKSLKSRDFYGFLATWAKSVEFQQPSKPNRSELHLYLHSCIVCVRVCEFKCMIIHNKPTLKICGKSVCPQTCLHANTLKTMDGQQFILINPSHHPHFPLACGTCMPEEGSWSQDVWGNYGSKKWISNFNPPKSGPIHKCRAFCLQPNMAFEAKTSGLRFNTVPVDLNLNLMGSSHW